MTKQRTSIWKTLTIAGALTLAVLTGRANAHDLNGRAEVNTGNGTTSKEDAKYTLSVGECNQPSAKTYIHQGDSGDFTSVAGQAYGVTAIGNLGDKEGYGLEATESLGSFSITANADRNLSTNSAIARERLGAGIDYKIGNWTLGTGFDNTDKGNQGLVRAILTEDNDQLGAGLRKQKEDNSASTFWCHYGPKESWGTRTWAKADWSDKTSDQCYTFDSITVENPTFSTASSPWFTGRNAGDMYDKTTIENPFAPERVPLNNRSKQGVVSELKYTSVEKQGQETKVIRADIGYTFPGLDFRDVKGIKPGALIFHSRNLEDKDKNTAGASGIVSYKGFCLEGTLTENLGTHKEDFYVSVGYQCPLSYLRH